MNSILLIRQRFLSSISVSKVYSLVAIVLLFLAFYGLIFLPIKATQWDYILFVLLLVVVVVKINYKSIYSKIILTYVLFVFLSCLYSWEFNDQGLVNVVSHSYKYFALIFFFYLFSSRLSYREVEKALFVLCIICCVCYLIQWLIFPTILFYGAEDEAKASIEKYRVRIPGSLCCYCLFFYGINQFLLSKDWKSFGYSILGFMPILIMGFRSLTALALIGAFFMVPFVKKGGVKTILYCSLGTILVVLFMQTDLVKSKYAEMDLRTQGGQVFSNEDYIRWRELDFYWNDYFVKPGEKIIGGGVPCDPSSQYRKNIYSYNFTYTDIGLVGLGMVIGAPAVLILVLLYLICIYKFKEKKYQYLRFTLAVILLGSIFTTSELYRDGNILLFSLILYINYRCHRKSKISEQLLMLKYRETYENSNFS